MCVVSCHLAHNNREPIHISYIPSHLYHMLFELFKVINDDATYILIKRLSESTQQLINLFPLSSLQNAMRATIENHEASRTLPPIKVMIALGGEDLSIKVREIF